MELKKIGRIWKDFKTIQDAMPSLKRRGCWSKCYQCEIQWSKIETDFVHMTTNEEGDTRFICDTCLVLHQK